MPDGKEHILFLGNKVECAKWVGFGKSCLRKLRATNQLVHNYRPTQYVTVRIERWGGVEKIIINAEPPPGPAFVGIPYDTFAFDGYGFDPQSVFSDTEIGTAQIQQNRATLIKTGADGAWVVERYPQYLEDYGGEPEWGNNVWRSAPSSAAITLSWRGLQSRSPQKLLVNQELFAGFNCQDIGFTYIGVQINDGRFCLSQPPVWYATDPYVCTALPSGSSNSLSGGTVLTDLFGQFVYKDGKRFYNAGSNQTIMGAAVRTINADSTYLKPSLQFLCVIGQRDATIGVYKEELYVAPFDDIQNGTKYLVAEYHNDLFGQDETPYFVRPEINGMSWNFSENGQFAVTMRQYYTKRSEAEGGSYFENVAVKLDVDEVMEGNPEFELDQLWNSTFEAPQVTEVLDTVEFSGEYVATVDVDGNDIVYAYIDMQFNRKLYMDGTTLKSETTASEYLRFSKFPDDSILLHQIDFKNQWYPEDGGRDYCYKDTFSTVNIIQALGCIDARYGILTTWYITPEPFREHTKGNIAGALSFECIPYPVPNTEGVKTYVGSKLIETKPPFFWDDFNHYMNLSEITCPDSVNVVVYSYNPFVTGDYRAHPYQLSKFGAYASSVVAARIDDTQVDVVLSYKAYNNGYGSTNLLLRIDRITGTILFQKQLDEVLQLGEHNPYLVQNGGEVQGPDQPTVFEGTYAYVGLI